MFQPRPKQAEVLSYQGGQMGVSAVPGSGKTATLSYLAAKLVATTDLASDQEVLVVTLVNAAAGNFAASLAAYLREEFQLLPGLGYRVRTLHGLANEIVRERPALAGLSDTFTVLDERSTGDMLQDAVETWIRANPDAPDDYLTPEHLNKAYTRTKHWSDLVTQMANNFIRQAKDMQLSAADVTELSESAGYELPLVRMCGAIYEQYERSLRYRGAVDFQDLIRLALYILTIDEQYLARLRHQFPVILEDEAQDSSQLQDKILRLLTGDDGNRVRVGDPNQAIYESFTTADPKYLREFLGEPGVQARTLPNSGRSTASIIKLANHLIDWSLAHPHPAIRAKQPLTRPYIEPTPPGDPQGNPPDDPQKVHLRPEDYTADEERQAVIRSLQHWLPDNPDKTCVVLVPFNASGSKLVVELRRENIPYIENLRSTSATRAIVGALQFILDYLANPEDSSRLARVYRVWRRDEREDEDAARSIENIVKTLRKIPRLEEYLSPRLTDWLADNTGDNETLHTHLADLNMVLV
ncbi:MAG: ATP-dependent helicase [Aggregatilineales bacterium]